MKRVVITGIGIHSCIGDNVQQVSDNLYHGRSGIGLDINRREYGYRSHLVGRVNPVELKNFLTKRERMTFSEEAGFAYVATEQALKDSNLDKDYFKENEVGILYGNDSTSKAIIETHNTIIEAKNTTLVGSGAVFQSMNSSVTMNLASIYKLRGINMTISAACASSAHAIGLGYLLIKQGLQNMIICGGAQEINPLGQASFDALCVFSDRFDEPNRASRPFDANRNGLVPSGGAGTLIFEEMEHALKRGAKIYGEVIGYGFSSNGDNISQPSSKGSERAIKRAVNDAGIKIKDISYINAHATSTLQGDACEAIALDRLFREYKTPISSTKSMTGHECWMAGASEIIYTLLMMKQSFIAPNINFVKPDEYSKNLNIINNTLETNLDICLSNSFGFGGTNSSILIKKIHNGKSRNY